MGWNSKKAKKMDRKGKIIMRVIIITIAFWVLWSIYGFIMSNSNKVLNFQGDAISYVVKFPKFIESVALLSMFAGLIMDVYFIVQIIRGNTQITTGHAGIGIVFIIIGVVLETIYLRWHIVVSDNTLICYRVLNKPRELTFESLDSVGITGSMIKLEVNGKTVTYVDTECDNFSKLYDTLVKYDKIEE